MKQRTIRYTVKHRCALAKTGPGALAFDGSTSLRAKRNVLLFTGGPYADAQGVTPVGVIEFKHSEKAFEVGARRPGKRVRWVANIEAPDNYEWLDDDPIGRQVGIDEEMSKCIRTNGGYPLYLDRLECVLWSQRFR